MTIVYLDNFACVIPHSLEGSTFSLSPHPFSDSFFAVSPFHLSYYVLESRSYKLQYEYTMNDLENGFFKELVCWSPNEFHVLSSNGFIFCFKLINNEKIAFNSIIRNIFS